MQHAHLISGTSSMRLSGLIYPGKDELDLGLAAGISADGEVYVSRKAAPSLTLFRSFAGVRDDDYESLRNWHTNVANGPSNAFIFIDSDGQSYAVRWINDLLDWQRDGQNRWSGTLKLRVEGFEP